MKTSIKPPHAFFVMAFCLIMAFVVGMVTAGFVLDTAAPYMAFGPGTSGRVVLRGRDIIRFSNGVEIRGMGLLPFWALFACVFGTVTLGLLITFLKTAIFILEWVDPNVGEELGGWWNGLWRKGQDLGAGKDDKK